jgi:hypothetical protein
MEVGTLLILIALVLVVIMFIARPFFDVPLVNDKTHGLTGKQVDNQKGYPFLMERYDSVLANIDELEGEFTQGKLTEDVFLSARAELLQDGTEIMLALQKIEKDHQFSKEVLEIQDHEQRDDRIEEMILEHRKIREEKMIGFCPRCGKPAQKSDVFCSRCGNRFER